MSPVNGPANLKRRGFYKYFVPNGPQAFGIARSLTFIGLRTCRTHLFQDFRIHVVYSCFLL